MKSVHPHLTCCECGAVLDMQWQATNEPGVMTWLETCRAPGCPLINQTFDARDYPPTDEQRQMYKQGEMR